MSWPWWDIQNDSSQAHRIIVADHGLIAKAADPIDINSLGQGPPRGLAFPGRLGKARVEIGFERSVNKARPLFKRTNPCQLELLNQTVLQGIEQSFDASLGLRGECKDRFNAQLSQRLTDLSGSLLTG